MKIKIGSYYQTIELHFPSYIEESENDYYKSKIFIYNRRTFELTEKPYNWTHENNKTDFNNGHFNQFFFCEITE